VDAVEDGHRRAPGPNAAELVLQMVERRLHPFVDLAVQALQVIHIHG
jgi:hypothetical protein